MIIATIAMVVLLGVATFGSQIAPWSERLAATSPQSARSRHQTVARWACLSRLLLSERAISAARKSGFD